MAGINVEDHVLRDLVGVADYDFLDWLITYLHTQVHVLFGIL